MQFSKFTSDMARTHGIEPKDVLFALLITAGAAVPESFATVFRPSVATSSALTTKASNYIGQRPGLKRLIKELDSQKASAAVPPEIPKTAPRKRGRPRKQADEDPAAVNDRPMLDYTDKDALLQEYARIAERCEKESDRLSALNAIANLQRMKQEAAVEDEKRVIFYIPLSVARSFDHFILLLADAFNWDKKQIETASNVIKPLCNH